MKLSGRPRIPIERLDKWANLLKPFLTKGLSLYGSIEKASLMKNKDSIYRNIRLGGDFCEKIHHFQSYPGEIIMSIFAKEIEHIHKKVVENKPLTASETRMVCYFATHYRSCESFFVQPPNRQRKREPTPSNQVHNTPTITYIYSKT